MKKLAKILVLVLSVALLVGALVVVASAAGETSDIPVTADHVKWTEEEVIKVFNTKDAYLAAKESGNYEGAALSTNKLGAAFTHVKNKGEGYILLTADYNEGRSFINDDNSALEYATVNLTNTKCTLDLNGKVLSMATNRWFNASGTGANVGYQRLQVSGSGVLTVIGNGGSLLTASNLVQFSAAGGTVSFDGGNGGLNIVACTGYSYDARNGNYNSNTTFAGSEGIVKNVKQGYSVATAPVLNILGDVTYVRENTAIASFYCMYGTKGSIKFNIGKEDADKSVRNTATFNTIDTVGSTVDSEVPRIVIHRDDAYSVSGKDVLTTNALLAEVNINNATVNCKDFKFSSLYSKNYGAATDDDLITYNINNSTLNFRGKDKAYTDIIGISMKATVSYRINVNSSEIYEGHNFINGSANPAVSATTNTVRALTVIKDSYVSVRNDAGNQSTFTQRIGSLVTENSFYDVGAFTNLGIYWLDYDGGAGKLANGTVPMWPTYAAEVGGYGVLIKDGNYFNSTGSKGNGPTSKASPGEHTGGGFGTNKLGNLGNGNFYDVIKPAYGQTIWKIVSDAAIPNVTTDADVLTFNGAAGTTAKDYTAGFVTKLAGSNLCLGASNTTARPGQFAVAENTFAETKNTYVTHKYWEGGDVKYSHTQPYFYYEVNTMSADAAATYPIDKYAYYAIDFDLMTTEEFFTKDFNPQFFVRSYLASGSVASAAAIILSPDGTWRSYSGDSFKMDYTPGVWQHVTTVLEMPMTDGAVDYLKMYTDAKIHLYVDGELLHTFTGILPEAGNAFSDPANYKDGAKYAGVHEVRISYNGDNQQGLSDAETAIDNVMFRRYAYTTTDTPATIGKYVYDNSAAFGVAQPEDVPFVSYDGGTAGQNYVESLISNGILDMADEGIELHTDYKGIVDLDAMMQVLEFGDDFKTVLEDFGIENFRISFKTNGYKINFKQHDLVVEEYDEETDIYTLRNATPDDYIKIYFHDEDSATAEYIEVLKNRTISPDLFPAYEGEFIDNKYAKIYIGGWAEKAGNSAIVDGYAVGNEDVHLYPGVAKIVGTLGDIFFNVSANDNTALNYYIPAEWYDYAVNADGATNPGFKIVAIQNQRNGNDPSAFNILAPTGSYGGGEYFKYTYLGNEYYCFTSYPEISAVDTVLAFIITYEVVEDGVTYTASVTYETSALDYCATVAEGNFTAEEKEIVANYLRYCYEYVSALNVVGNTDKYSATLANIEAVYTDEVKALCTELEPEVLEGGAIDLTEVAQYLENGGFAINGTRFNLQLSFKAGSKVKGVSITTKGFYIDRTKPVGEIGENLFEAGEGTIEVGSHSSQQKKDADGYYTYYNTANLLPYNMFDTITVVLLIDDGSEEGLQVSGTYSLAAYYNTVANTEGVAPEVVDAYAKVITATKELGDSVKAYRFEEIVK